MKNVLTIVLVAVFCVGAYALYWVVAKDSTNRRTDVNFSSYAAQMAARDTVVRKVSEIEMAKATEQPEAVIIALTNDACQVASRLTAEGSKDLPVTVSTFIATEC